MGRRFNTTIRQLGYPTKNSLIGCYREYEQSRDLQVGYARSKRKYTAEQIQVAVQHYLEHDRCIGSTIRALGQRHLHISEKVIQNLMKQELLVIAANKKRRHGSYLVEISPAPENISNRDFYAGRPNEKWLTDITEIHIPAGKVYLSPLIDCFDCLFVSWTIRTRRNSDLVNTMLDASIETVVACESKPIINFDRGAHYRWPGWL
ncbi:hypothetical protein HC248_01930 [Polaromonas vacuolata]|uniref:Integrase catalytic domain-containing protein n=1 Tax=Polaromonas vacuolata TaxID=37448 RepID=A0A6H2H9R6_9BURK|nr:hypothetical protein HC248_01930 [Polaromonas vacuolata]